MMPVSPPYASVRPIKNGYILQITDYGNNINEEWFCIHLEEVNDKMSRYL